MNGKALIEVLKVDGKNYHPEHGIRAGLEKAIDMVKKLDKPLVVPKHIGNWLDEQKLGYETWLFSMIRELTDMWVENGFDEFINQNKKELIEVLIGNREYVVEDEKLYYIKLSDNQYAQWFDEDERDLMLVNNEAFAGVFTEKEIKTINPNLMVLAVEVAE